MRATVPEGIVAFLDIEEGDKLEWKMDIKDDERIAIVRKRKFSVNPKHVKPEKVTRNAK